VAVRPVVASADDILIAGGGLGGLATALALARLGRASRILERNPAFSEAGAGIQIGPNGMRVLELLGAERTLRAVAVEPLAIRVVDGPSGAELTALPLGGWIAERHGAPYCVAHRADVQNSLLGRVREEPLVSIETGFAVSTVAERADGVEVTSSTGEAVQGAALVAADGTWSAIRPALGAPPLPHATRIAARTVIAAEQVPDPFRAPAIGMWLAPRAHVVHYPVRGGAEVAVVAIFESGWRGQEWATLAERDLLLEKLATFAPPLRRFLAATGEWRKWSLFDASPLPRWSKGRVALLGDAAHPLLPFLAQGGVLALEDAVTLAAHLQARAGDPERAFAAYARERRPRARRVQDAARRNGRIYHLSGAMAAARNLVLRRTPPQRLMASYDWLYGWKPPMLG
jgi:salicylate hydroxylase